MPHAVRTSAFLLVAGLQFAAWGGAADTGSPTEYLVVGTVVAVQPAQAVVVIRQANLMDAFVFRSTPTG